MHVIKLLYFTHLQIIYFHFAFPRQLRERPERMPATVRDYPTLKNIFVHVVARTPGRIDW